MARSVLFRVSDGVKVGEGGGLFFPCFCRDLFLVPFDGFGQDLVRTDLYAAVGCLLVARESDPDQVVDFAGGGDGSNFAPVVVFPSRHMLISICAMSAERPKRGAPLLDVVKSNLVSVKSPELAIVSVEVGVVATVDVSTAFYLSPFEDLLPVCTVDSLVVHVCSFDPIVVLVVCIMDL